MRADAQRVREALDGAESDAAGVAILDARNHGLVHPGAAGELLLSPAALVAERPEVEREGRHGQVSRRQHGSPDGRVSVRVSRSVIAGGADWLQALCGAGRGR